MIEGHLPPIPMNPPTPYTKPKLRDRIKARIMAGSRGAPEGQWSARKAQLLAQEYEAAGGGYKGPRTGQQRSLSKWTGQEWTTKDGKPAARKDSRGRSIMARYLPKAAWAKLTKSEAEATDQKKRAGSRKRLQVIANTLKAKEARKDS